MMISSAVKNIILFSNILGLILSAVAVIEGFIFSLTLNKLLPQGLLSLMGLAFLHDLPQYLQVVGSVGFIVTFFGSTGAFLDGRVGKCLLVMYTVTLTLAVALEMFILSTLFMSHRGLGVQAPMVSPLTADLRVHDPSETKEDNYFTENMLTHPEIINLNKENDDGYTHLRNRREIQILSKMANYGKKAANSIKHTVKEKTNNFKDRVSGTADSIKDNFQDKANEITNTAMRGVEKVKSGATKFKSGIESVTQLRQALGETAQFLIGIFASLTPEEEERVKKIKPLLGKLTGPAFHLTKNKYIMIACVTAIILEICFILLGLYLFTTKDERVELCSGTWIRQAKPVDGRSLF